MSLICSQTTSVLKTHDVKCCYENHLSKYDQYIEQLKGDKLWDFKSAPN
jgi:ribosomal protein L16 Arg81 hydroxylase